MKLNITELTCILLLYSLLLSCSSEDSGLDTLDSDRVAYDGNDNLSEGNALEMFLDPTELERFPNNLLTNYGDQSTKNSWFCSIYSEAKYISRSVLKFNSNYSGTLDDMYFTWELISDNSLNLIFDREVISLKNITFSSREDLYDIFSAVIFDGAIIDCDWNGVKRSSSDVLNDGTTNQQPKLNDDNDLNEVEYLLVNSIYGSDSNSSWFCYLNDSLGNVDHLEYYFYSNNYGHAVADFRWFPLSENHIRIVYQQNEYELYEIVFIDDKYNQFVAKDSRGYKLECEWKGKSRTH